ncbi:MAG: hypothetical protein QOG04_367 [Actinomycetota bacterium]|jgi:hypothetical protein|nr:hypothetical protein [Actinomycetota bacterium]
MRFRRVSANVAAGVIGVVIGAVVVLAAEGVTRDLGRSPTATPSPEPSVTFEVKEPKIDAPKRTILLAWAPGGLPVGTEEALEAMPEVVSATTIRAGLDWIESSTTSDGADLDDPPKGLAIPFEVAIVDPNEYADYVAPSEREAILGLEAGGAVLAQTESELRQAGSGLRLKLRSGRVTVKDVISDAGTQGYEALLAGEVPETWERTDRFVLMRVRSQKAQRGVGTLIRSLLAPGQVLRIRAQGETPFLRYGDAVLPQLFVKGAFGEFAAAPNSNGSITIQESWKNKHITAMEVPILGEITCHRGLFPQLIQALHQVEDAGLSFTVDPHDFGGCFSARFIDSNPGGRLSHHSWGIAVDFNAAQNRPGTKPDIDHRLVRIMEDNGFTWGGRWLVPDGMHFEWVRFP